MKILVIWHSRSVVTRVEFSYRNLTLFTPFLLAQWSSPISWWGLCWLNSYIAQLQYFLACHTISKLTWNLLEVGHHFSRYFILYQQNRIHRYFFSSRWFIQPILHPCRGLNLSWIWLALNITGALKILLGKLYFQVIVTPLKSANKIQNCKAHWSREELLEKSSQ